MAIHKTDSGLNAEEFNKIRDKHLYGSSDPLHAFTRNQNQWRNF
jgi:hypothetical protein